MGKILNLFGKNKCPEQVVEALAEGVEKIVQYGKKTLKVMKPKTEVFSHYNGGMTVHESMEGYYAKAGLKPIGHSSVTRKDVFVYSEGENPARLVISDIKPLNGNAGFEERGLTYVRDFGTPNARQSELWVTNGGSRRYSNPLQIK